MEKYNAENLINPQKSEHLASGEKPIIACVGAFEDYVDGSTNIFKDAENINWFANERELGKNKLLNAGIETYVISTLNNRDKVSYGLSNCTVLIATGKDKKTGENISFLSHQFFGRLSNRGREEQLSKFIADVNKRLLEVKQKCLPGTIDAVIVGGTYFKEPVFVKNYKDAIETLSESVKNNFGFEPVIMTGPKINSEDEEDVFYDTQNRRVYIERPVSGTVAMESYLPSDIENEEKKWRSKM